MTQSLEDYLETIYIILSEGRPAQVRDVARLLDVKMPSVVKAMAELKKLELVIQEPYGDIELTAKGRKVATGVLTRHTILKAFLLKLGVTEKTADNDACLMEHILSAETMDKISDYLKKGPPKVEAAKPEAKS
jgi:DtxR family Mn-dependent transcriptional regulator